MLMRMKKLFGRVCVPDELDMIEHYRTPAEQTADLVVHVVGLTLAAVGGIVLAVLAALYSGVGTVVATAAYALCLIAMLFIVRWLDTLSWPLWASCLTIFVVAWIGQFIGHSIEGTRPSFFKDVQFLLIGPIWLVSHVYRRLGVSF